MCFQAVIVLELRFELPAFVLQDPDADEVAGNVVLSRQAVQALPSQELLRNLALECHVERPVARHGPLLTRPGQNRSISQRPPVHLEGCTLHFSREQGILRDRKSTRLNSSHLVISYAVFCLKKKKIN